ncbi:MAG: hypothetical protein H6779_03595 [Candidatus Nomurabacteria bacterium]|nr:hypothetical protein [Candidatus Nomurabacteria bacterium]USN87471.1 MAG: hypothetical protein H6779_03595 [Candidatus Nomurabacteria bacterium]
MKKIRGGTHTTLTETAEGVVQILETIPGVTLVSPGIIKRRRSKTGKRHITGVFTTAGMELIISGQSTQKVAVHCNGELAPHIFHTLSLHKKLAGFSFRTREKKPGV